MFHLFVKHLETLGDQINPITLRDLRRLRQGYTMEVLAALLVLATVPFFWLCFFADEFEFTDRSEMAVMFALIPAWLVGMFALLTIGWPIFSLVMTRSKDELLGFVPLPPKQQLHGYFLTSALMAGFFSAILVPFYVVVPFFHSISPWLLLTLAAPLGVFLNSILYMLLGLSFVARASKTWEVIVLFFVINYVGTYAVQIPMLIGFFIWVAAFGQCVPAEHVPLAVTLAACLVPMAISLVYLAYRLSLYQFGQKSMSPWAGAAWSTLAYGIWSTLWTIVGLAVSAVYFAIADTVSP